MSGYRHEVGEGQKLPCVVIAARWAAWLHLATCLNLACIEFHSNELSSSWLPAHALPERAYILSRKSLTTSLLNHQRDILVFIQGTTDMLSQLPSTWFEQHHILWAQDSSSHPDCSVFPNKFHIELNPIHYEGVLYGQFHFYSNRPFSEPPPPSTIQRRLRHILSPATKGVQLYPVPMPESDFMVSASPLWLPLPVNGSRVLDWSGGLPADDPLLPVRCKSVFTTSKWCIRRLSSRELAAAHDVPSYMIPATAVKHPNDTVDLPFLFTAPIKLLLIVASIWSPLAHRSSMSLCPSAGQTAGVRPQAYPALSTVIESKIAEFAKSVKADDAAVPIQYWNDRIWDAHLHCSFNKANFEFKYKACPLDTMRVFLLKIWRVRVTRSLLQFLRGMHGVRWPSNPSALKDMEVGRECLYHASGADWWEWRAGSTLFFWRWPRPLQEVARDGHPVWWTKPPPTNMCPQFFEKDPIIRAKVTEKLENVRFKRYLIPGEVKNLTHYFAVPKGDSDIRIVYDATKSGLNDCIWVPSFTLPGADAMTDMLDTSSFMMDLDLGEMFLNFPMHHTVQPYCGLDVRPYLFPADAQTHWERWGRCMMGWRASPYLAVKYHLLADEIVQGDRSAPFNPFGWDQVVLNLPGASQYDPTQPWVYRIDVNGKKACGGPTYVDDVRMIGHDINSCWAVAHGMACTLSYLGIQVASRKTRPPSQTPGAWAGIVAMVTADGVSVSCTPDKWNKAKGYLQELRQELESNGVLNRKSLEQKRGFFNHLQRTYPAITPFLKGFHLTIDGWRPNRDEEMWKVQSTLESSGELLAYPPVTPPILVQPAPRFQSDLQVLMHMFSSSSPAIRLVRSSKIVVAIYGFGDASGSGFGASLELPNNAMFIRYGVWGKDEDSQSSNYRELCNLVDTIEAGLATGDLANSELFLFTDNMTAEGAYYRGNSDNKELFHLVVRLRSLDMMGNLRLHIIHVAGTRMMAQGTDGLSRGQLTEGVLAGTPMSSFIPLHLSACDRSPAVLPWVRTWCPTSSIEPLSPAEWYTRGHGWTTGQCNPDGVWMPEVSDETWFLWAPAPAAAHVALREMSASRHKRTQLNHIFLCPRLCTHLWRKWLFKIADIVLEIPAGCRSFWPSDQHEPLILGLTLRFSACPPWQLRNSPSILDLGRQVQELWVNVPGDERGLLRQLCHLPVTMEGL
jgi:hypothetical protein